MMSEKINNIFKCKRWFAIKKLNNKSYSLSNCNFERVHRGQHDLTANNLLIKKCLSSNSRQFHTFSKNYNYYTTELKHARKVMSDLETYSECLAESLLDRENLDANEVENVLAKQWISMSNSEILENFEMLSYYAKNNVENESIDNPKYRGITEIICNNCQGFNDQELHHLMNCLILWNPKKEEQVFKNICKVIDDECMKRMPNWSINEILVANDQFYKLKIARLSDFSWHSLRKLNLKLKKLSPTQLVQFAFLLKVNREIPMNLYNLEYYAEQYFDQFTLEELGIIAMPFAKYDTPIRSKNFLIKLIQKFRSNIDNIDDVTFTSILKIIRYFHKKEVIEELEVLLKSLVSQISFRSLPTVSQIGVLKMKLLMHNKDLLLHLLERFEKNIKDATIRDFEKALLTACTFNYNPEKTLFYSLIERELLDSTRTEEINNNLAHVVNIVKNLVYVNYCPKKCLQLVMDPETIKKVSNDNVFNLKSDYLFIDYCLELDHPQYDGLRLNIEMKNFLLERHGAIKEKVIHRFKKGFSLNKIAVDVLDKLKELLSSETMIHYDSLLPYLPAREMVLCYDPENKEFVSPVEKLSKIPTGSIKYAPDDGKNWYVVLIGTFNRVAQNTGYPTGFMGMYMRHLKIIGYDPILITNQKWNQFTNNGKEKKNYLSNILKNQTGHIF